MIPTPVQLTGAPGSPYTRKMLSLLRFRRIPYRFYIGHMGHDTELEVQGVAALADLPKPRVNLMPTFYLPAEDNTSDHLVAVTDSTPIIRRFEATFPERGVVPPDPALALLDELLEDFADEWLTKAMFHYRWSYPADIDKARRVLPFWQNPSVSDSTIAPYQKAIGDRQISRLGVVGSNEVTAQVIEASYQRILELLNSHIGQSAFLMGQRPGSSDFAFLGQLMALVIFDPTSSAIALEIAPRIYAWVERMEDLSGLDAPDDGWQDIEEMPTTLHALLAEVGRGYVPVMMANAEAVTSGADEVRTTVDGAEWIQKPFPYQAKCLLNLRKTYAALPEMARTKVDVALKGTGCEALFK